jgi:hypothetical protein
MRLTGLHPNSKLQFDLGEGGLIFTSGLVSATAISSTCGA